MLTQSIAGLIRTAMTTHARDASVVGKALSLLSSLASTTDQRDVAVLMSFTEPIAAAMAGHDADAGVQVRLAACRGQCHVWACNRGCRAQARDGDAVWLLPSASGHRFWSLTLAPLSLACPASR